MDRENYGRCRKTRIYIKLGQGVFVSWLIKDIYKVFRGKNGGEEQMAESLG
jgi:hypothetical protein